MILLDHQSNNNYWRNISYNQCTTHTKVISVVSTIFSFLLIFIGVSGYYHFNLALWETCTLVALGTAWLTATCIGGVWKVCRTPEETGTTRRSIFRANSTAKELQENHQTTHRKGQICISTLKGGYIGHPSKRQLLPHYLTDMTLEDGSPLPLDAEDFFVELYLFNMSRQLENTGIPSTMYLPGRLFRDKKDNDTIKLRYEKKLIALTIEQQNHGSKFAKGTFEKIFALQTVYIKEACDLINPLFCTYDPYWFYSLGNKGVVFKLETHNSETVFHLKESISEDLRPKLRPEKARVDILLSKDKRGLIFVMEYCLFQPQDFDIVLNETHLIIYGRFENRNLACEPLNQADTEHVDVIRDDWQKGFGTSREAMFAYRWDKTLFFKDHNIEEMKTLMKNSTLLLNRGILKLHIPLHQ